jgi:hypothetical protein
MYKIEKNVEITEKRSRTCTKFPYKEMEVGDSFEIDLEKEGITRNLAHMQTHAIASFNVLRKSNPEMADWKIITRSYKTTNTVRVWRIA